MATALQLVPEAMLQRLRASPSFGVAAASIRRTHRVPQSLADAPSVYIVPESVDKKRGQRGSECVQRELAITVAIVVRSDNVDALDPILEAVMDRLNPETTGLTAYPSGVEIDDGRLIVDTESADQDATRCDIVYTAAFVTGEHTLVIGAP